MADTKNLCAQIPASLHSTVRERQEAAGQSLSQYMTWLITKFYESEEKATMNEKENVRTVAFQVPEELFERFKAYLELQGIKQKAFFLACIQQALADSEDESTVQNE
ncbi:MAG: hypothetical protein NC319_05245 [Butyricicoccus sp.]|nr:hypothetical protein [Butyricicoccus sp.]